MNGRAIRVGLVLPMFSGDAEKVVAAAREADALGFDGMFAFDHFFPPGAAPDRPAMEAFTTLAGVAAVTRRVALGTLVTRAVLRPPGLLAKTADGIDRISGGRMILGIGTGDPIDRPEHHAFGFRDLGVRDRRLHLAETVAALQCLFRGEPYEGGVHLPPVAGPLLPPPVRQGGPPVWVGGRSDEVVRIAGSLADGWNGWELPPDEFERKASLLADEAARAGREVEATWAGIVLVGEDEADARTMADDRARRGIGGEVAFAGSPERFAAFLLALAGAGATWAIVVLAGPRNARPLVAERTLPGLA